MDLKAILSANKSKIKNMQPGLVRKLADIAECDRPYSTPELISTSLIEKNREPQKVATKWQQTDNKVGKKQTTNRQQTGNKLATNWQQSGNRTEHRTEHKCF